jgi:flagellar basal-body rod protein FlgG
MTTGFHTAATGMIWAQKALDVTANNVANLSTNGYKADQSSFADLLYTEIRTPGQDPKLKVGSGSKLSKTDTLFTASSLEETGAPQDYGLTDARNFFAVRMADGTTAYTRNGNFSLSLHDDGQFYLSDDSGEEVLDFNGAPIVVTDDSKAQNVGVFTFRNLDGLQKAGGNNYVATERSGEAYAVQDAEVRQGYLETSSADLSTEFSNLMMQQRAYELDAKMVVMTDDVMQTVNSLR